MCMTYITIGYFLITTSITTFNIWKFMNIVNISKKKLDNYSIWEAKQKSYCYKYNYSDIIISKMVRLKDEYQTEKSYEKY